jgi:two-component system, cell cycle response regulator
MALTDELTGLYNRRGFLLLGSHNLRLALRSEQPLFLFFADVDCLKQINDDCGHVQGDALLVGCAEVLKMTFRESDIVSRIGGDEFAILAHGNSNESRSAVLNRLRSSIDLMNRDVLAPYQLSLSVGVATFDPLSPVSLTELLSIADREMMARKPPRSLIDSSSTYVRSSNGNGCLHA